MGQDKLGIFAGRVFRRLIRCDEYIIYSLLMDRGLSQSFNSDKRDHIPDVGDQGFKIEKELTAKSEF